MKSAVVKNSGIAKFKNRQIPLLDKKSKFKVFFHEFLGDLSKYSINLISLSETIKKRERSQSNPGSYFKRAFLLFLSFKYNRYIIAYCF